MGYDPIFLAGAKGSHSDGNWLQRFRDLFGTGFAAQDRIFHRVIVPAAIASGSVDVEGLQVFRQWTDELLSMLVKDDVGAADVEDVSRQYRITLLENSAFLEIAQ